MYHRILIAVDDSAPARHAADEGAQLARQMGADVLLLHVVDLPEEYVAARSSLARQALLKGKRAGRRALSLIGARMAAVVPHRTQLRVGEPAATIVAVARAERADLIVIGTHGRSGLHRLVFGSTAERVLRQAPCPVLAVRPETDGLFLGETATS